MFRILIDGECPLCKVEGDLLAKLDKGRGRLLIEDITAPSFDPGRYGVTMDDVMGSIHGITDDGSVITGMAVFRRAYDAVGWGWLWAPTGWPVLKPAFDAFYRWFAKNRMRLTFRKDACATGRCAVPSERTTTG